MRVIALVFVVLSCTVALRADADDDVPRRVVDLEVRGDTKLRVRAMRYIANVKIGDMVRDRDRARMRQDLVTSELFEQVEVTYEPRDGGVVVVATLKDKHSWIVAPTVWFLAGKRSLGVGYAENDLFGLNQKLLLYGQIGDRENLVFATFLDDSVRGTRWTMRVDFYAYDRVVEEYLNPPDDPRSTEIARTSRGRYTAGGLLIGWNLTWWAIVDARIRAGYTSYSRSHAPDGSPLPNPAIDGRDIGLQTRLTIDARKRDFGVTSGPYLQLHIHRAIPGLDQYGYTWAQLRAYNNLRWGLHQLEGRLLLAWGEHLPPHEEWTTGGATDLRGYAYEQFRGDVRTVGRLEYSFPLFQYRFFAFRGLTFLDSGYVGFQFRRPDGKRDYLPTQSDNAGWFRNNVGAGFRVYVRRIVLPLVGFDLAYGIEARSPELYFQLGLTDF